MQGNGTAGGSPRARAAPGQASWRQRAGLFAGLALLASAPAHGGASLDASAARDRALNSATGWWGPEVAVQPPGLSFAWSAPRRQLPSLIGEPFAGRGGVRWLGADLAQGGLRARLGVAWRDGREPAWSLEGSRLSWSPAPVDERGSGEFYASVERRHWGPGWTASLILDGSAPAVAALGWRRTELSRSAHPWMSWLGPWGADVFVGRLQGHRQPERPSLFGMRLVLAPLAGVELGLSRTIQWGGRGRDERWSSLRNALLGRDNVGFDGITADNEPGNQLAGADLRWTIDPVHQTAVYAQGIGEDEAGKLPSRNMVLVGIDSRWATEGGVLRFFVEYADVLAGRVSRDPRPFAAYRHAIYRQGYTHEGQPLGHPAGGDLKLASVGTLYRAQALSVMGVVSLGHAEPSAERLAPGVFYGFETQMQWPLDAASQLHAGAAWYRDSTGRRQALRAGWRIGW